MLKYLSILAVLVAVAACLGYADQSNSKIIIPVDRTSPISGKQMFTSYCAPCHGVDGKGHGPAAAALRTQPTDLTGLAKKNHGRFPDTHIVATLQFGTDVAAHGNADMPVWGPILGKMNHTSMQEKQLRISNLSRYIQSLQNQ